MANTCCGGTRKTANSGKRASCCGETATNAAPSAACCALEQAEAETCGCASDPARFDEKWVAGR